MDRPRAAHHSAPPLVLAALVLAACGDDGPAGPGTVDGAGTIQVSVTSSGATPDTDGYVLTIEGLDNRPVADGTVEIADVPAGTLTVELTDLAVNCSVDGDNPRDVTVSPDEAVMTTFAVQCPLALLDAIVFQTTRTGNREIFAMPLDGGAPLNLSNDPGDDWLGMVSPDGTRVLIDSERNLDREIFVVNADGSGLANLTNVPFADDAIPYWSPDGTQILFETGRDGDLEIYMMNADGSGQVNFTNMPGSHERFGSWSPEGVRILFTSNRDGPNDIYSMWFDGSNLVNLTNHPAEDFMGVFSPDGRRIAFTRRIGADTEVYVMNADGSGQTNLTQDPVSADELPHWSPDGSRLVFSSTRSGSAELWTMAPDGSDPRRLTDDPMALNAVPRWGPGIGLVPEPPEPPPMAAETNPRPPSPHASLPAEFELTAERLGLGKGVEPLLVARERLVELGDLTSHQGHLVAASGLAPQGADDVLDQRAQHEVGGQRHHRHADREEDRDDGDQFVHGSVSSPTVVT